MLNGQEDLMNLNERFGNLFYKSSANKIIELNNREMSGLCYWCESRAVVQCRDCARTFCKFCIKNGHSNDESQRLCFICGCFEIREASDGGGDGPGLRDREMQDMLHRYEHLCSNDRLADSIDSLLASVDSLQAAQLPAFFELTKSNILSMLHDVQKIETMLQRALADHRQADIDQVLIPLARVVTKHHVFKRLGRPQTADASELIDLTDDEQRMDHSTKPNGVLAAADSDNDDDNERMQRSPMRLGDEEKSTTKFEIPEEYDVSDILPAPVEIADPKQSKRRRTRQSVGDNGEKLGVRLRSETAPATPQIGKAPLTPPPNGGGSTFFSDLSAAATVFSRGVDSPVLRSDSRKKNLQLSTAAATPLPTKKPKIVVCKEEMLLEPTRYSSSSLSSEENLTKFSKIVQRNKNSHLVCAAPLKYEKPFLLKETRPVDAIDDIRPPVSNKTWSWERQLPTVIIKSNSAGLAKSFSNGADSATKTVAKSIAIDSSGIDISLVRSRSQSAIQQQHQQQTNKRSSLAITMGPAVADIEEPKKKRGRPRKYFTNYTPDFELTWPSNNNGNNNSVDEQTVANRNSSDVSDGK